MIAATGLNKIYRENGREVSVFDALDLHCAAGEYIALMGPSGAGKTSLLQLLGCLDRPDSGQYLLDGETVSHLEEEALAEIRNRKIGFVFQTNHFVDYLDLVENVALPGFYQSNTHSNGIASSTAGAINARATKLLCDVGLSHRLDHLPQQLSGGERQRAAIARALFNEPRLLLADEPTGNLDTQNSERILALIESLLTPAMTVIMVTHDTAVANRAQRQLELRDGQLRERVAA